ncbi:hypothetical protein K2173_003224 [Erythroxylum novogranatense]|uniref:WAT1-related protein n=1 Tax=Erythroxylum novogranatense TaxID=1862640 RepID=A0AAV8SXX2_9ROSI|nr:hypothetical protein K2173_003224 [Erythroxylum novogranatense]
MWVSAVTAIMILLEFFEVGMNTVNKVAMNRGLSRFVLVVYSNFLAIILLLSSTFIFYRKRTTPTLTWCVIWRILILGILSCSGQFATYVGIGYSTPTLASAMTDLTPAFTFIFSIVLRMEKFDLRTKSSQAKSIGTVALITGGLIVTLYKGLPLTGLSSSSQILEDQLLLPMSSWVLGGVFLALHSLILALIFNVQIWIIRDYPAELIVTLICCVVVAIISAIVCLFAERNSNAWRIGPDIKLIAIGYSGVFAGAIRSVAHLWACHKRGPIYASMFKPLGMVIAVFMGVPLLGDTLYLGSVIGAVVIALGFYSVIWGKAQEKQATKDKETCCFVSSSPQVPLLQDRPNGNV